MSSQLALLTDLYQLSMACGYWHTQVADREAVFHLTFRRAPFGGAYAVAAGLSQALEYLHDLRFEESDCAYLATLQGNDGKPMFATGFLDYLRELKFNCTVDAVPDGRVVFPHQPLLRVRGPIIAAQLVETALLTAMNFHTLIATKASRVVQAARGAPVLEFGLRRAQGFDGGLSASRAAYLGGCAATSNVLAGKMYGIPVRGTHAHSWVMFHGDELQSFRAYAAALPSNCTFLVDTFDTIEGVRHAITVGHELRAKGYELAGIRLDSGDLAYLSQQARAMLDAAGFANAKVVASNDLDEHIIASLHEQGAQIDTFGVGTKLVTAFDQPALGGVYKLGAVRGPNIGANERTLEAGTAQPWRYAIKLSEQPIKISNPGQLAIRRLWQGNAMVGDVIFDQDAGCGSTAVGLETDRAMEVPAATHHEDIMVRVMADGALTAAAADASNLVQARARATSDLQALSPRHRRFVNPEPYWVGLDQTPADTKRRLVAEARASKGKGDRT
ncbi:MAG: nicotinate phosphoribosyltransferase [Kofleriaceae bacterium]|nr:nicotinate phosphoribosyltransferase [Kofleriaceae bacterium]